jgi:hypothetical protein
MDAVIRMLWQQQYNALAQVDTAALAQLLLASERWLDEFCYRVTTPLLKQGFTFTTASNLGVNRALKVAEDTLVLMLTPTSGMMMTGSYTTAQNRNQAHYFLVLADGLRYAGRVPYREILAVQQADA